MRYWLMKSEPDETSIDHLAAEPARLFEWTGVRNYQARNFMRDEMRPGDKVLFWHSSCPEPGIAGIAEVAAAAHPDSSQFDPASPYLDAKSDPANPRWLCVDVRFVKKTRLVSPAELRQHPMLESMTVLKRGNRLSITPVTEQEWAYLMDMLGVGQAE
ncbi:EVE domain-containing protein [Chromobacterium sp. IIBBL 290-4]|uniref:EVE domain-containing protein n=1 Tax=Chromobacterium sp. IIBBL 290-4 TaxID=2953890 RepID=UPI0020B8C26F|nr:EVE domain-containing protein [Chromobacterium sp. IIBBL 290-4]UTH76187.1 EVE domain-containing protein [Chromobacterium sp. IIBBL 290-4]